MSKSLHAAALAAGLLSCPTASMAADTTPIRIGVINDASGGYADLSGAGSAVAARLAVDEMGGSVLGRPIEVLSADNQSKPDIASALVRRWVDVEGVTLIADGGPSSSAASIQQLARARNFVFVNAGGYASSLTGKDCARTAFQFAPDTYALSSASTKRAVARGDNSWFFMTADYTFGQALEADASASIKASGGRVLGSVRHPLHNPDFSSFLLQAQASRAKVVGLASAGADVINSVKQAHEFGLIEGGQKLAGFLVFQSDVDALGLDVAQGLEFATATYWDSDERTRAWSRTFQQRYRGKPPTMVHSLTYSGVLHYLKAVQAAGTLDGPTVAAKMRETRVNDVFVRDAAIREDGRVLEELMLVKVKAPSASKHPFDDFEVLDRLSPEAAYRPLSESECPLVQKN
ncbi:ABC transporter substrate-binding protein [Methylobacterium sp. J-030]|uniref:ABC transporter substrate-binding protein n=1 Tax=Methylobacterium sp. J-030 TaxID=2836627 RepID=UPI001FB927DF|nr:ABC transporter substrate-binding protein [Methylobacterium sp. J-030]MCJ2072203.1 ABC transporter substrate-binding protein [Methylobacterium sp. J-030]